MGRIIQTIPNCELFVYDEDENGNGHKNAISENENTDPDNGIIILKISDIFGHNLEIPLTSDVYYKGGWARLILKLYFYFLELEKDELDTKLINLMKRIILAELPLGDCDIITTNNKKGKKIMEIVGENDSAGIGLILPTATDLDYAFASRDVSMNLVLFSLLGLLYSPLAEEAVKTGTIFHLPADHGIYSKNYFVYQGHYFIQDREYERLIKFLLDDKAIVIEIKGENLQLFMGRFALVGIGRFIDKEDAPERIEKMYYLLGEMGQLEQYRYVFQKKLKRDFIDETEFCELLHCLYPDFRILRNDDDYFRAQWYNFKLLRWFRRTFKTMFNIKSNYNWLKLDEDEKIVSFDLKNFKSDPEKVEKIRK